MKRLAKPVLALLLCMTLALSACSTTWISTLDNILVAAAPALVNILNIVALAEGKPLNSTLAAKITTDASSIQTLAKDFAGASSLAAPGVCSQLQAAITTYSQDESQVMSLASVSDPATEAKIETLSALVAGTITAITDVIPSCSAASSATFRAALGAHPVPLPLKSFVRSYNAVLTAPTGKTAVDSFTKSHQVHVHSLLFRTITIGHSF